jgi:hypothetical protein
VRVLYRHGHERDLVSALVALQSERRPGERWVFTGARSLLATIPKKETMAKVKMKGRGHKKDVCSPDHMLRFLHCSCSNEQSFTNRRSAQVVPMAGLLIRIGCVTQVIISGRGSAVVAVKKVLRGL